MARPVCPHTLDDALIDAAALWASHALRDRGVAHVELSPGDDTMYGVLVSAPAPVWQDRDERQAVDYTVALRFGDTHPWGGRPDVHPSYAAKTWGRGNVCTGEVVARFLNALGEKLADPEPQRGLTCEWPTDGRVPTDLAVWPMCMAPATHIATMPDCDPGDLRVCTNHMHVAGGAGWVVRHLGDCPVPQTYDPHRTDCNHNLMAQQDLTEGRSLLSCAYCPHEEVREADGSVVPVGEG